MQEDVQEFRFGQVVPERISSLSQINTTYYTDQTNRNQKLRGLMFKNCYALKGMIILSIFFFTRLAYGQINQKDPLYKTYNLGRDDEAIVFKPHVNNNHTVVTSIFDTKGPVENGLVFKTYFKDTDTLGIYGSDYAIDAATGDLNADGQDNIVAAWQGPNRTVTVMVPQIDTTNLQRTGAWYDTVQDYGVPKIFNAPSGGHNIVRVATGRFDATAAKEFVVAYCADTGSSKGGPIQLVFYKMIQGTPTPVDSIKVGDAIVTSSTKSISGSFGSSTTKTTLFDMTVGDFNGDGIDEVAVMDIESGGYNKWNLMAHIVRKSKDTGHWEDYIDSQNALASGSTAGSSITGNTVITQLSMAADNFFGEGHDDLAYAYEDETQSGSISPILYSVSLQRLAIDLNGSGNISNSGNSIDLPAGQMSTTSYSVSLSTGDYNYNGTGDVVARVYPLGSGENEEIAVYGFHSNGTPIQYFNAWRGYNTSGGDSHRSVVLTDCDLPYSDSLRTDVMSYTRAGTSGNHELQDYQAHPYQIGYQFSFGSSTQSVADPETPVNSEDYFVLVAGDLNADGVHLGAPTRMTAHNIVQPLVILNAPPFHYDIFNGTSYDINNCFGGNGCGASSTYVASTDSSTQVSTEVSADWGVSNSLSEKVSAQGGQEDLYSVSASVEGTMENTYGGGFSKVNGVSKTYRVTVTTNAAAEDLIYATVSDYYIYEYPTYVKDKLTGHVAVVLPKFTGPNSLRNTWFSGKSGYARTYLANHEVGNILSYPDSAGLPSGANWFGGSGFARGGGADSWDMSGTSTHNWELDFNSQNISEKTRKTYQTLSRSITGNFEESVGGASVDLEASVSGTYSNDQISTQTTTVQQGNSLQVNFGTIDQSILGSDTYTVSPYVYWDKAGALVLNYAVNPDQSTGVSSWWTKMYGSEPDLTFNLPWFYDQQKGIGSTDPQLQKNETRDIIFDPVNPQPGEVVSIYARVDNYSLKDMSSGSTLKFYYGDPQNGGTLITSQDGVDSVAVPAIKARGHAIVKLANWMVPSDLNNESKIYAVVDPNNTIAEIHEDNNIAWNLVNPNAPTGTAIEGQGNPAFPAHISLGQNYPNPFNPTTTITYSLLHAQNVSIKVYDVLGREVATLFKGWQSSGTHKLQFNALNLASGMYFYQMRTKEYVLTKKMLLLK